MLKTQAQSYLRVYRLFSVYTIGVEMIQITDPNFPPVLLFPCERLTGLCVFNVPVLLQPVIYRQRLLG